MALQFPLLVFNSNGTFRVATEAGDLDTATMRSLKRTAYMDAVDGNGNAYRIVQSAVEPPNLFARLFGRPIPVEVEVESRGRADLGESAERLCRLVADAPDVYAQFVDCEQIQERVRGSADFGQLIAVATSFGEASRFSR